MTMGSNSRKYPGPLAVCFLCIAFYYPIAAQNVEVVPIQPQGKFGENATLACRGTPKHANITWWFQDKPLVTNSRIYLSNDTTKEKKQGSNVELEYILSSVTILNATFEDAGNYTCVFTLDNNDEAKQVLPLDLKFPTKYIELQKRLEFNAYDYGRTMLKCGFEVYNASKVLWWKKYSDETPIEKDAVRLKNNLKQVETAYELPRIGNSDNGTYVCQMLDPSGNLVNVSGEIEVIVYDHPLLSLDHVIGINTSELYLNWTIQTFNSKIISYFLYYRDANSDSKMGFLQYTTRKINNNDTSFVMTSLNKSSTYALRLEVNTTHGVKKSSNNGTTLDEDPVFVPNITINGFSATSVTIGWAPPPSKIEHLIHYYLLEARKKDGGAPRKAYHARDVRNLPYMFDNLQPHSTYIFKARACQDFTKQCGEWSGEMEAATMDGIPGRPANVTVNCTATEMYLTWQQPEKPNAEIKLYKLELTGTAVYRDRTGVQKNVTLDPSSRFKSNNSLNFRFDNLQPNTNYTVRVWAKATLRLGEDEVRHCRTWQTAPDAPPRPRWRKISEGNKFLFKLHLPKVSERNGPICCYRVLVVRLWAGGQLKDLRPQHQLDVAAYEDAHSPRPSRAAYITDVFDNENFPKDGEIIIGDESSMTLNTTRPECLRCLRRATPLRPNLPPPALATPPPPPAPPTEAPPPPGETADPEEPTTTEQAKRERRSNRVDDEFRDNEVLRDAPSRLSDDPDVITPKDGPLDPNYNYTLFVELIPGNSSYEPIYSEYASLLSPAPGPVAPAPHSALELALQVSCALAALVLVAAIAFCLVQSRRSRKLPRQRNLEMNPIRDAICRYVLGRSGGRGAPVAELPPIARAALPAAYAERHADSDYGFQKEFELLQMQSERYTDRTTHASEARENQPKNRYPDIKAYDQTRVKLSQIDGITGSDYINANYVMGYKERKRFICAQGPTDTTVNDFWRMVWEHGLELIVMLTNLEEYSKVKCSKYWPDAGSRAFGAVSVTHIQERRYSDYIVRELRITKQPTNSEGQPIVENNGVAKRNGDIKEGGSVPTSPRDKEAGDANACVEDARIVRQYHFLMWKDFAAPEHPHSILKFIKRVNEAWSTVVNRPAVVHCSAGVGRTGTLVALDCLLDQLDATGQAAVFNTIAELRRQRNFLVQSQKQYVFVYRALVEHAHYGDTELAAARLKAAVDRLRTTPDAADKCLMELQLEKLLEPPVSEPLKSTAAAGAEEVRARNRSQDCLPYDRNRVMLAPLPARDYSTYINASFIEAYDNSEGFIITQDPLPNTIFDFWRMVSEQSVSTIVMLSELGEGKCPRYWDDGAAQHEHITVAYDDSESCPYYTRRHFRVTNTKSGVSHPVRQVQYQGWPTAAGAVPEVTRGLAELADASTATDQPGPMLVHCHTGTERSALFVALCILIAQLRAERRVDVSAVARRLRAQRSRTIDTFTQYEFLHRAILNYAELHNLLEDS